MTEKLIRTVALDAEKIRDRESMAAYMKEQLELPDYFGGNLDALADLLSEMTRETVFEVPAEMFGRIPEDGYAAKTLRVLNAAASENPHLHLYLTDGF